uniref:Uncharacterized protein n=1 Tax=Aegilops tauschii subsp. strangulata TaxID=200361 RepID=A0A453ILB4_AEGTS
MLVSLLQVASILVHLARLSLLRIISDIKVNNDLCRSHLVRGKRLVNDAIRIAEKILNPSREDQKKPKNAFGIELERIAATGILLEALEIVGHLDSGRMAIQAWAPAVLFLCFIYTFGNYWIHHLFCLLLTKQCSL